MKTRKFFSKLLLLPLGILLTLTSCIDKIDPISIGIGSYSFYIIQQTDAEGDTEYLPYIGFWYDGEEKLDYGVISKDGEVLNFMTDKNLQICQINPQDYKETSLEAFNGKYTFNPVGTEGNDWERSFDVEFKGNETVGSFDVTEFGYKNGRLHATFTKGQNILEYGFRILPVVNGSTTYYALPWTESIITPQEKFIVSENETSITMEYIFNPATMYLSSGIQKFRITPMAYNYTSDSWKVIRLFSVSATLDAEQYQSTVIFYETETEE